MQMKNPRGVQQHEVDAAADALVANRQRPTIERVRHQLGRGSPNTIAPLLEAWFATLAPRLGIAEDEAGRGGAPAEVRHAVDVLWQSALRTAHTQAQESLQSDKNTLAQEQQALVVAQSALSVANEQLVQRETLLRAALAEAQTQVNESKKRTELQETELARMSVELGQVRDTLGKTVVERDADRRQFDAQLTAAAQERDKQQERAAGAERRLLEEVDRARQETKQVRSELTGMGKKFDDAQTELVRLKQQLGQAVADNLAAVAALTEKLLGAEQRVRDYQSTLSAITPNAKKMAGKKIKSSVGRVHA